MSGTKEIVRVGAIEQRILLIRGEKVIIDADLARFYGVSTKRLNEQIKRNRGRFPADFMFQLTREEAEVLRSQFATSNSGRGGRRYMPHAFTEHGAIMAASVLNSRRAVEVSVFIVRAFVKLRQAIAEHKQLAHKIAQIERRMADHDVQILQIIEVIKRLAGSEPVRERRQIGFRVKE